MQCFLKSEPSQEASSGHPEGEHSLHTLCPAVHLAPRVPETGNKLVKLASHTMREVQIQKETGFHQVYFFCVTGKNVRRLGICATVQHEVPRC